MSFIFLQIIANLRRNLAIIMNMQLHSRVQNWSQSSLIKRFKVAILALLLSLPLLLAGHTYAADVKCSDINNPDVTSSGGFVQMLCSMPSSNPNANVISVLIETGANWLTGLLTIFFGVVVVASVVSIGASGASPEGIKSAKKRITNAVVSIVLFWTARIVLDLTGITSGKILGVSVNQGYDANGNPMSNSGFNIGTFLKIFSSVLGFLQFVGGAISVIVIIIAGIRFMTSQGQPNAIAQAKKMIAYAVFTLIAVGSAQLLINIIGIFIKGL